MNFLILIFSLSLIAFIGLLITIYKYDPNRCIMTEPLYTIEEFVTTGWIVYDEKYTKMDKQKTQEIYEGILAEGMNPSRLRITRDV